MSDVKTENLWLMHGNCLDRMKEIPDGSVDAIICDPPYQTTSCAWDSIIPLDEMWAELNRVVKTGGAIVMTASQPFTSKLIISNIDNFAHCWVWNKRFAANFVQAKRQPLKDHEDVVVFSNHGKQPFYFPQMIDRDKPIKKGGNKQSEAIPIAITEASECFGRQEKVYNKKHPTSTCLNFSSRVGRGLHPTQKPVALMEYLIKTYTNEGETVLDFTAGSFTTGVACVNLNRKGIMIEKDPHYFKVGSERVERALSGKVTN